MPPPATSVAIRRVHAPRAPPAEPTESAKAAGLRYVNDADPGIRREKHGRGFRYVHPDGAPVTEKATLARIRRLAIPPAWRDVWICPDPRGHVQATGRDDRGRKQYRYHERWREARDESKYHRMIAFGHALPRIRARVEKDLALPGMPRAKVLAAVVRLLETTFIRVGNGEYARTNHSFGLTTLRTDHVDVRGGTISFRFRGKSGKSHEVQLHDKRLARIVRRCQDLPGQELFTYLDEAGEARSVRSQDVNDYLRDASGEEFTAKDFRTWAGTVLAALALLEAEPAPTKTAAKRAVSSAIKQVAARLGNTPAVCRKAYVHPAILDSYLDGTLAKRLAMDATRAAMQEAADHPLQDMDAHVLALVESAAESRAPSLEAQLARSLEAAKGARA